MFDARVLRLQPARRGDHGSAAPPLPRVQLEALEQAGHVPETLRRARSACSRAAGQHAYMMYNLLTNPQLVQQVGFFLLRHTGNDKDFLATRVSYLLNLTGRASTCRRRARRRSSRSTMAAQSLLNGECDMALAGGVTIRQPHHAGYLYKEGEILSPDGHCRAFDAELAGHRVRQRRRRRRAAPRSPMRWPTATRSTRSSRARRSTTTAR